MTKKLELKFHNTKTRKVELFTPEDEKLVKMYSCGPTVYSYQHIGNMKAAIFTDILRRVVKYAGYNLYSVQNITDVGHLTDDDELGDDGEDKMIKAAKKEKKTPLEIANHYTNYYLTDLERLRVELPTIMPRATEHIQEQLEIIEQLEKNGVTYTTSDGVYFDVSKYKEYGKLSGQKLEEKETGVRIDVNSEKRNPQDFALWKFTTGKHEHHSMRWDSKWGVGFPGWHIECSAMGHKYLGKSIDIHTGGVDHIPIHHENEIAQNQCSGCITNVSFWMHNGHLTVNSEKMAKSVGNVYLIEDLIEKGYSPLAFRLLLLQSHYRKTSDFTLELLQSAQHNLERIENFLVELYERKVSENSKKNTIDKEVINKAINKNLEGFDESISDDLNTARALKYVYEVMNVVNSQETISQNEKDKVIEFFKTINQILAIIDFEKLESKNEIPQEVEELAEQRKQAKADKNFNLADELRDKIKQRGYFIKDDKKVERGYILIKE